MGLRDAAVAASATASDQATQAAKARTRATAAEIAEKIKTWFVDDVTVVWKRSSTWDKPHIVHQQFGGERIFYDSDMVHTYDVDDVTVGVIKNDREGLRLYVVTECTECNGPTLSSGVQYDTNPWGYGLSEPLGASPNYPQYRKNFEEQAGPEFVTELGHAMRAKVRCPACLLRLPKHCPTCERRIRP